MKAEELLNTASRQVKSLSSNLIDIVEIKRPETIEFAISLVKVISKLSPIIGNMLEFTTVDLLNKHDWKQLGKWVRQDPGFPDAVFSSNIVKPNPGIEVKAWLPFATEITARFKESQNIFKNNPHINVALIAWLPENIIWGKPFVIDTLIVSGESIAKYRDNHYHLPPSYIVLEPEDTSKRKRNLQQTNTNGQRFQGDKGDINEAEKYVATLGKQFLQYSASPEYQDQLKQLQSKFPVYRNDTNYAKIDRIAHPAIEKFKNEIMNTQFRGKKIIEWANLFSNKISDETLRNELEKLLD